MRQTGVTSDDALRTPLARGSRERSSELIVSSVSASPQSLPQQHQLQCLSRPQQRDSGFNPHRTLKQMSSVSAPDVNKVSLTSVNVVIRCSVHVLRCELNVFCVMYCIASWMYFVLSYSYSPSQHHSWRQARWHNCPRAWPVSTRWNGANSFTSKCAPTGFSLQTRATLQQLIVYRRRQGTSLLYQPETTLHSIALQRETKVSTTTNVYLPAGTTRLCHVWRTVAGRQQEFRVRQTVQMRTFFCRVMASPTSIVAFSCSEHTAYPRAANQLRAADARQPIRIGRAWVFSYLVV